MLYNNVLFILTVILGDQNITQLKILLINKSARNSIEYCSGTSPMCQPASLVNVSVPSTSSGFLSTSPFIEGKGIW